MVPAKNLHISDDLLVRIEQVARSQGKTADEVAESALRANFEFHDLLSQGHAHARSRGYKPSDVMKGIAEYRSQNSENSR
jgi:hypothetical protein